MPQKAQILPESGRAVQNAIVKRRRSQSSSELSCEVVLTSPVDSLPPHFHAAEADKIKQKVIDDMTKKGMEEDCG